MAVISIGLDAMAALLLGLKDARRTLTESACVITRQLQGVWLSTQPVAAWREGGWLLGTLDQMIADCDRRLAKAREINASRPGVPQVKTDAHGYQYVDRTVSFEEDDLMTADAEAVVTVLDQIASGRIHVAEGLPPDLLTMLLAGMDDPVFAQRVTESMPPGKLAEVLRVIQVERGNLVAECGNTSQEVAGFDAGYAQALDAFGSLYSLTARTLIPGSPQAVAYLVEWQQVFSSAPAHGLYPTMLSLVVARGRWPDEFLTGMVDAISSTEGAMGAAYWGQPESLNPTPGWPVIDPGRSYQDGRLVAVGDPMYGIWSAAVNNPEWMWAMYHGGDTTDVLSDRVGYDGSEFSEHVAVPGKADARLVDLFRNRGMDEASVSAFLQAASVADLMASDGSGSIIGEVRAVASSLDRDQWVIDNLSWWEKHKHLVVEAVVMVAGLAAVFVPGPGWLTTGLWVASAGASAVDARLYVQDGDELGAMIAMAFAVVPVKFGGTTQLLRVTTDEIAALERGGTILLAGKNVRLGEKGIAVVLDDADGLVEAGVVLPWPEVGDDIVAHWTSGTRITARDGVVGGHSLADFEQAFRDLGLDPAEAILSKTEIYPGVFSVEYQVPLRVSGGRLTDPVQWKVIDTPKTVYDPGVVSDEQMLQYAQEAMENATPTRLGDGLYEGTAPNGWTFRGWINDGEFTTVFLYEP